MGPKVFPQTPTVSQYNYKKIEKLIENNRGVHSNKLKFPLHFETRYDVLTGKKSDFIEENPIKIEDKKGFLYKNYDLPYQASSNSKPKVLVQIEKYQQDLVLDDNKRKEKEVVLMQYKKNEQNEKKHAEATQTEILENSPSYSIVEPIKNSPQNLKLSPINQKIIEELRMGPQKNEIGGLNLNITENDDLKKKMQKELEKTESNNQNQQLCEENIIPELIPEQSPQHSDKPVLLKRNLETSQKNEKTPEITDNWITFNSDNRELFISQELNGNLKDSQSFSNSNPNPNSDRSNLSKMKNSLDLQLEESHSYLKTADVNREKKVFLGGNSQQNFIILKEEERDCPMRGKSRTVSYKEPFLIANNNEFLDEIDPKSLENLLKGLENFHDKFKVFI